MMKLRTVTMPSLILAFILTLTLSTQARALYYTSTLTDSGPGAGITYNLDFNLLSGTTYNATFTIQTSANTSPEWYGGYFLFKLDGSSPSDITNLTAPSGPWSVWDGDTNNSVNVLGAGGNHNQNRQDSFSGFYVTSLAPGAPTDDITQGIHLTGGTTLYTFTFLFTVPDGHVANTLSIPFQVGFYDGLAGNSGNYVFNQLSGNLVPEPGTLLLLGSGLLGGAFVRRRLRKRD